MRIATWNVNGIRAREAQLLEWIERDRPDVFCLQEIKAQITQLPLALGALASYDSFFHGSGGYSGVSVHVRKSPGRAPVVFSHPPFDFETRVVEARMGDLAIASVYAPNGGKDYPAKLGFYEAMIAWARASIESGTRLVIAGDLNIAHQEIDVHPSQRSAKVVGQRPEERALFDALLETGLVDVTRALHPTDDRLFSWWPYWREARQKNVGWRLDYVLATRDVALRAKTSVVDREFGASDHAPLVVDLDALE
jgi:exodeoxyribonuclease-3